jgi:predicted CopG family antitoxin
MVKQLSNYSTISVPEEVKKILERAKGEKDWGAFLLEMYTEADLAKRTKAFSKLVEKLSHEDLESIVKSSREFREGLRFK